MRSKHLIIADNRTGLITPILRFLDREEVEYDYIDAEDLERCNKYPSVFHRIYGKIGQLATSGKRNWGRERLIASYTSTNEYDRVVILIPAMLNGIILRNISSHSAKLVCMLWDSLKKEPAGGKNIDLYDAVYSFDKDDMEISKEIRYFPNYIPDVDSNYSASDNFKFDVCGYFRVSGLDDIRYKGIEELAIKSSLSGKVYFVSENVRPSIIKVANMELEFQNNNLDGKVKSQLIKESKAILDYVDPRQKGLSPRLGEAYQFSRLLVTNNTSIDDESWFKMNTIVFNSGNADSIDLSNAGYTCTENPRTIENWINCLLD